MEAFSVGHVYPQFAANEDMARMGIANGELYIICNLTNPSQSEIKLFQSGSTLALTAARYDDLLVMTAYFGGEISFDMTYTPHLGGAHGLSEPSLEGMGYPLTVYLFNESGKLLNIRRVGLSGAISCEVYSIVRAIQARPFSREAYMASLNRMYQTLTTDELAALASPAGHYAVGTAETTTARVFEPASNYPGAIPREIDHLYTYVADAGHSILAVPERFEKQAEGNVDYYLVPMPVKLVLAKGYRFLPDKKNIVVPCEYDDELGLVYPPEYDEY